MRIFLLEHVKIILQNEALFNGAPPPTNASKIQVISTSAPGRYLLKYTYL
jgi:hypothetical protein